MRIPSGPASRPHRLTCPLCGRGVLDPREPTSPAAALVVHDPSVLVGLFPS